jgi:peptide/nickel transport system permease protein
VVLRHALPNALLPVLTITGITVASLIGGALLIEVTFSWPASPFASRRRSPSATTPSCRASW